ncbi:hypothetical protein [Nonomuraea sp. NPDC049684]|uniref:hypothetical protein n=1 Tax=Nonomuraea sp. NPDC049684 TaxID=3364356 RepID=UPI0037A4C3D4
MYDLPPSAFKRSAPFDPRHPRHRRGPVRVALGLARAVRSVVAGRITGPYRR